MRMCTHLPKWGVAVIAFAGTVSLLSFSPPARANVIFTIGNDPQPGETNIFFGAPATGMTIDGTVGQTGPTVQFTSTQTLFQKAMGQADIMAEPDPGTTLLTNINISVPGNTFGDFIMNPLNGDGNATVTVTDNMNHVFMYDLGNGQNYLTITTAMGESIAAIELSVACVAGDTACMISGPGFIEFKQPRISDVCNNVTGVCVAVPEPSGLLVVGGALLGLLMVGWRHQRARFLMVFKPDTCAVVGRQKSGRGALWATTRSSDGQGSQPHRDFPTGDSTYG